MRTVVGAATLHFFISASILLIPIRITSLRVDSNASAHLSSCSTVSLSIRTRIIVSFGFSDFGLPIDGDTLSPRFLSLQLLYVVATRKSTPPAKKITNNPRSDFNCTKNVQLKSSCWPGGKNCAFLDSPISVGGIRPPSARNRPSDEIRPKGVRESSEWMRSGAVPVNLLQRVRQIDGIERRAAHDLLFQC